MRQCASGVCIMCVLLALTAFSRIALSSPLVYASYSACPGQILQAPHAAGHLAAVLRLVVHSPEPAAHMHRAWGLWRSRMRRRRGGEGM